MVKSRVRLLGRPQVDVMEGAPRVGSPRGRKAWAVLCRTALSARPLTRAELATELFGAADDPLGALRWALADLRRALGRPKILLGDPLQLDRSELWLDVWALEDGELPALIATGCGSLLEGVEPVDCPEFELWLLTARSHAERLLGQQLRRHALRLLAAGSAAEAVMVAGAAAERDPLDPDAQELLLRALVADDQPGVAAARLAVCEAMFRTEGLSVPPALRQAARAPAPSTTGLQAAATATALLKAGRAALGAGLADAGIETLRRANQDAERSGDDALRAEIALVLGEALVHAVRGSDGEGAVVLARGLQLARRAGRDHSAVTALRELAFVDVQAGRHSSVSRWLAEAAAFGVADEDGVRAGLLSVDGMNQADVGRHTDAVQRLRLAAELAGKSGQVRQQTWAIGVMARSLLLLGQVTEAMEAAQCSVDLAVRHRWPAFLPWPQAIRAEAALITGQRGRAQQDAEEAFALGCELGDPCWEGAAARVLGRIAMASGDLDQSWSWLEDARRRADRVSDRYVWISGCIGLARLELSRLQNPGGAHTLVRELADQAAANDLPEFHAWALVHGVELNLPWAAAELHAKFGPGNRRPDNPKLDARITAALRSVAEPDHGAR